MYAKACVPFGRYAVYVASTARFNEAESTSLSKKISLDIQISHDLRTK